MKRFDSKKITGSLTPILLMVMASILFGTGNAIVKSLSPKIPSIESVFARSVITLLLVGTYLLIHGQKVIMEQFKLNKLLVLRGLLGSIALICYFYAITHLQLGVAAMVNHTSPLFTAFFAFFILRERLSRTIVILMLIGFVGVLFIVSPNLSGINLNALVGLSSAFFAALAYITVRYLGQTVRPAVIIFYYALISTIISFFLALPHFVMPSFVEIIGLSTLGIISIFGQVGLTLAYKHGKAGIVAPFMYVTVLVSFLYGIFLFNEIPKISSAIGSIIILISGIWIAYATKRENTMEYE